MQHDRRSSTVQMSECCALGMGEIRLSVSLTDDTIPTFMIQYPHYFAARSAAIGVVCKIPLLARALARPSARATIGYLVYNHRRRCARRRDFVPQSVPSKHKGELKIWIFVLHEYTRLNLQIPQQIGFLLSIAKHVYPCTLAPAGLRRRDALAHTHTPMRA